MPLDEMPLQEMLYAKAQHVFNVCLFFMLSVVSPKI